MSKPKTLVNKATTDDRNPPSGYILQELAQKSNSIADCDEIESLVLKKLSKNKPYVKKKALRIIKYICENGSPQWRRSWQRHTDKLKECQQYRGPPDQVYGDSPYKEVRDAAKEAMSAVFAATTKETGALQKRIHGLDGTQQSYSNSGSYSSSSSNRNRTATFGSGSTGVYSNPSGRPRGPAPNRNRNISGDATGNTKYKPQTRTKPFEPLGSRGDYNPSQFTHKNPHSNKPLDNRTSRGDGKRKKKSVGGMWGNDKPQQNNNNNDDDDDYDDDSDGGYNDTFANNESSTNNRTFGKSLSSGKSRKVRSDGRFERKWVDDITKGSGVGIKISQNDLTKYVQQFENLSQDHVLEYLDDKLLSNENWKESGKALTLIEALLNGSSQNTVEEYFQSSPESLQFLLQEGKPQLRRKANTIVELLGIEDDNGDNNDDNDDDNNNNNNNNNNSNTNGNLNGNSNAQPAAQAQQPKEDNLLNFDIMSGGDDNGGGDDLLAGLETVEDDGNLLAGLELNDNNNAAPAQQSSLLPTQPQPSQQSSLLPTQPQTQNQTQANQSGSLLLPTADTTNTNTSAPETKSNNDLGDIFAGLGNTQEDTNLNQIITNQGNQQQAAPNSGGTGFSFVNGNAANNSSSNLNNNNGNTNNNGAAAQGFGFVNQGQQNATQPQVSQTTGVQQGNQGGFSFVQGGGGGMSNMQQGSAQMNQLRNQTQQNVGMMNQMLNNMNQMQNMMNQAANMNGMNNMNNMNAMNNMGGGMNNMGMNRMGMNNMGGGMNMNAMNMQQQMGNTGMGFNPMQQMAQMSQMGGTGGNAMHNMNNMQQSGQTNGNAMSAMMMNNMNNFTGLTTTMNQRPNPLNQMRQNDPFAAVMSGPTSNQVAQQQKKQQDLFGDLNLKNLT